jgi:hypothetical protein
MKKDLDACLTTTAEALAQAQNSARVIKEMEMEHVERVNQLSETNQKLFEKLSKLNKEKKILVQEVHVLRRRTSSDMESFASMASIGSGSSSSDMYCALGRSTSGGKFTFGHDSEDPLHTLGSQSGRVAERTSSTQAGSEARASATYAFACAVAENVILTACQNISKQQDETSVEGRIPPHLCTSMERIHDLATDGAVGRGILGSSQNSVNSIQIQGQCHDDFVTLTKPDHIDQVVTLNPKP